MHVSYDAFKSTTRGKTMAAMSIGVVSSKPHFDDGQLFTSFDTAFRPFILFS